jgi:RNA polymerase sigma factor (sigma-70 family)
MAFRPLSDNEIFDLSDDDLVAYIAAARSRRHATWRTSVQLLIYRHEPRVRRNVTKKLPFHLVEDITEQVMIEAYGSLFSKDTPGQFFSWLDTITHNVIADHYRTGKGKVRHNEVEIPENQEGSGEISLDEITASDAFGRALAMLDNEMHREVIRLYIIEDRPAKDVADEVGTTENNVHQIAKRFREILRGLLDEEDWA